MAPTYSRPGLGFPDGCDSPVQAGLFLAMQESSEWTRLVAPPHPSQLFQLHAQSKHLLCPMHLIAFSPVSGG